MRFVLHCGEWLEAGRTRGAWRRRLVYEVEVLEGEEDVHLSAEGAEVRTDGRLYAVRQRARPRELEGTVEVVSETRLELKAASTRRRDGSVRRVDLRVTTSLPLRPRRPYWHRVLWFVRQEGLDWEAFHEQTADGHYLWEVDHLQGWARTFAAELEAVSRTENRRRWEELVRQRRSE